GTTNFPRHPDSYLLGLRAFNRAGLPSAPDADPAAYAGALGPASAWLEIAVNTGSGFETLGRQRLTATPFSLNTRGLDVDAAGVVKLDGANLSAGNIDGGGGIFNTNEPSGTPQENYIRFLSNNDTKVSAGRFLRFWSGMDAGAAERMLIRPEFTQINNELHAMERVGIGTTSPSRPLHVATNAPFDGVMTVENSNALGFAGTYFVGPSGGLDGYVGVTSGSNATWIGGDGMQIGSATNQDVIVTTGSAERMRVTSSGNVGIGTNSSPSFRLEVNGSAGKPGGGSWSNSSDRRLKTNIAELDGALDTILALKGVTYEYKDAEAINELPGERIGFIAQDVEAVIPDWIDQGADGFKRMTIRGFEALAVEAFRDQQQQIAAMQAQTEAMKAEIESLRSQRSVVGASAWLPLLVGGMAVSGIAVARRRQNKA
ncbi:MAG: tail fiber domain-containing protein, partial [Planctomycetota bacterium]